MLAMGVAARGISLFAGFVSAALIARQPAAGAKPLVGTVVGIDGAPVAGARVLLFAGADRQLVLEHHAIAATVTVRGGDAWREEQSLRLRVLPFGDELPVVEQPVRLPIAPPAARVHVLDRSGAVLTVGGLRDGAVDLA